MITIILGGIGLFLLGMLLMTDGLKAIAGASLHKALARFTSRPIMGLFSGALATALVQSSSVTTLITIGFVSAGLLTFSQTLGLILGINLGTTGTGWIVSQIGFKVNIGSLAFPFVAFGTLARLFSDGKLSHAGSATAGFGLIFLGISTMQGGMAELSTRYDPASFPSGGLLGSLLLVGIGLGMTVVMQSSSAALATTLAALFAQAITLDQAAALVIGQNVGTTVKAAIAAMGATPAAKQTAAAHITFNVVTAFIALLALPWLIGAIETLGEYLNWSLPTMLAAFHTTFNVMGVLLFFPFIGSLSNLMQRIIPDRGVQLTRHLNARTMRIYPAAIEAARQTTLEVARAMIELAFDELTGRTRKKIALERLRAAGMGLSETRRFLAEVQPDEGVKLDQQRHASVFHAIDHLWQLEEDLSNTGQAKLARLSETCREAYCEIVEAIEEVIKLIDQDDLDQAAQMMETKSLKIADIRRAQRRTVLDKTAEFQIKTDQALQELEAMRYMDRTAYHIWRSVYHLRKDGVNGSKEGELRGEEVRD
jgi:phosphate:Na+ symporter